MRDLDVRLARWVAAGIVTAEQAEAIRAAETAREAEREAPDGSLAATALGYLGASVALVGGVVATAREWSDLSIAARLALALGATLALLAAGFLARRRSGPAFRSLDGFLWFLSTAGAAFAAGLVAHDVLELETRSITMAAGAGAVAWGAPLWRLRSGPLQELAVFAGAGVLLEAILAHLPGPPDELHGLPLWGLAAAWAVLGAGRVLARRTSLALGGAGLLLGAQILSFGWRGGGLALGLATAGALLASSVALASPLLLAFGAAGILLFLPQIVFEYLGDTLGAPLALLVCGIAILAGAFATARLRRAVRRDRAAKTRRSAPGARPAADRRRSVAAAAAVALAVAGVVWGVGIAPLPQYESLAERPDPSIPGRVAFLRSMERPCVWVVRAAGGPARRIACTRAGAMRDADWLGGPLAWTRDGRLAVQAYGSEGNALLVLDPETGRLVERLVIEQPFGAPVAPDGGERADGARIVVTRSGRGGALSLAPRAGSPREIARVSGPPGYGFADPRWSPDGRWILVRDTNQDLLVVRAEPGARPRLLADRVWGEVAWEIPGTGGLDVDSLRAARLAGRASGG